MNTGPIVVEQNYNAPIAAVWKGITGKGQIRRWFFESMSHFEPEVGFETQFDVQVEEQSYAHQWKVTEVVPERRIA